MCQRDVCSGRKRENPPVCFQEVVETVGTPTNAGKFPPFWKARCHTSAFSVGIADKTDNKKKQTSHRVSSLSVRLNIREPLRGRQEFFAFPCKTKPLYTACGLSDTEHASTAPPRASALPCAHIPRDVTSPESPRASARLLMDADTRRHRSEGILKTRPCCKEPN